MNKTIVIFILTAWAGTVSAQDVLPAVTEPARTLNTKYRTSTHRDPAKMSLHAYTVHSDNVMAQWRNYWELSSPKVQYKEHSDLPEQEIGAIETVDNPDGTVTVKWEDGSVYRGQMYYGEIRGVGTMIYPDGSSYSGEWSSDRPNGNGTFVTPEGVACEVGWTDGIPHGRGIIQDTDGKLYSAKWRDGVIKPKSVRPVEN